MVCFCPQGRCGSLPAALRTSRSSQFYKPNIAWDKCFCWICGIIAWRVKTSKGEKGKLQAKSETHCDTHAHTCGKTVMQPQLLEQGQRLHEMMASEAYHKDTHILCGREPIAAHRSLWHPHRLWRVSSRALLLLPTSFTFPREISDEKDCLLCF